MTIDHDKLALRKLQYLHEKFAEVEIESKVVEKSDLLEMSTLLVSAEKDYLDRDQFINLAYLLELTEEDENLMLLQFFTELSPAFEPSQLPMIESLLAFTNIRMPIGHFGTQNNKIHYRYVMVDTKDSVDHAAQTIETFFMYLDVLDIFQESLENVILNKQSLEAFKAKF